MTGFLNDDGSLRIAEWATPTQDGWGGRALEVGTKLRSSPMYGSTATGDPLVSNGQLGVDVVRVPAGGGFAPHTHPGDHLLFVVAGEGTITYEGRIYPTRPGQVYLVEGAAPHAVGAITDHVILAAGSPHRSIDSADRMTLTDYAAVAATMGVLECLICDKSGDPAMLRSWGCGHTPIEAPGGRPITVGIAPASKAHRGQPAFLNTRSGARLAQLYGVEPRQLLDVTDTANVFEEYLPDWQAVPVDEWRARGEALRAGLAGRVVVACGRRVAEAVSGFRVGPSYPYPWGWSACCAADGADPYLVTMIPHPSGLSRTWNRAGVAEAARVALATARTLASAGPPSGRWEPRDAHALGSVAVPAFASIEA